jgi:hypothetical protein
LFAVKGLSSEEDATVRIQDIMRLEATIPDFSAETTKGPIKFYEWQGDS